MKLLLLLLIVSVTSKCGLHRYYEKTQTQRSERHHNGEHPNSKYRSDWSFGFGYGYQSNTAVLTCNDLEMYYQCERAQRTLDRFLPTTLPIELREIRCMDYIVCAAELPGDGEFWCQNLDSYFQCIVARNILIANNFSDTVICRGAAELADGRQLLNYRTPRIRTATPTTAPTTATPTAAPTTAAPTKELPPTQAPQKSSATQIAMTILYFGLIVLTA